MVEFRPSEDDFMQKTFITERYKLVVYHAKSYGELYDLQSDPDQRRNLWDLEPELRAQLLLDMISAEMEKDGVLRERVSYA